MAGERAQFAAAAARALATRRGTKSRAGSLVRGVRPEPLAFIT